MANGNDPLERFAEIILDESKNLVDLARPFKNRLKNLSPEERKQSLEDLQGKLLHIGAAVNAALGSFETEEPLPEEQDRAVRTRGATSEEGTAFSDFLAEIGDSVVQSQEKLDQRSIDYLQSIRNRPYIPPTLFRIPKIAAELKIALEENKNKKLNVILYSQQTQMKQLQEQSLNFEIAAVPPSPELLQILQDQTPRIEFLFDNLKRLAVFKALDELGPNQSNPKLKAQLKRIAAAENQNQVLIWPIESDQRFLILFAGEISGEDVGIWYLDTENQILSPVLRLDLKPKAAEDQEPLRRFIFTLGNAQARLFGGR